MRIPTQRRRYGLRFDLTPLNDIVFLLIIFLVAAPHFTTSETREDVDLAKVPVEEDNKSDSENRLELTVRKDGELRIGGKTIDVDDLRKRINAAGRRVGEGDAFEMRLRLDRKTKWAVVEPILIECALAKITDIKYAVMPE